MNILNDIYVVIKKLIRRSKVKFSNKRYVLHDDLSDFKTRDTFIQGLNTPKVFVSIVHPKHRLSSMHCTLYTIHILHLSKNPASENLKPVFVIKIHTDDGIKTDTLLIHF